MRHLIFFSMIVLLSGQAMGQSTKIGTAGDWNMYNYHVGSMNNCYASKIFTSYGPYSRIYISQAINRSWTIQLNPSFDDALPDGEPMRVDVSVGKYTTKSLAPNISSNGATSVLFSRRSRLAKELKKAPGALKLRFYTQEDSATLDFAIPEMPQIISTIMDCVKEKRKAKK